MALMIRLRQQGTKNRRMFRLVVMDRRAPREGKYLEMLGWYNPYEEKEKSVSLNIEKIKFWLGRGAMISERAKSLVKKLAPELVQKKPKKKKKRAKKAATAPLSKKAPAKKTVAKKEAAPKKKAAKDED